MKILRYTIELCLCVFMVHIAFSQEYKDFTISDGINIFGIIQPQYKYSFLGKDYRFTKEIDKSGFYFHRARLGVAGSVSNDFSYLFLMDFSSERELGLRYASITYNRFKPFIKASIGLFKAPFGLEYITDGYKLNTINRSLVTNKTLGTFRNFGIVLSGSTGDKKILGLKTKNVFSYKIAIIKGDSINISKNKIRNSYIGRIVFHPRKFITIGSSLSYCHFAPEAISRYNYPPEFIKTIKEDYIFRSGYDIKVEYKNVVVAGEYIKENSTISYINGACCAPPCLQYPLQQSKYREGYYIYVYYKATWRFQPLVKYENYRADTFRNKRENSTVTFGVNYIFNEWTKLQINYLYNVEELKEIPNDILLIQVQALIK